jgi:Ni/Fe-hydrogenase 1 B-type cytochrome subunit
MSGGHRDHPFPARAMHLTHLVCMVLLVISGIYIHIPFGQTPAHSWRFIHMLAGIVVTLNLVVRLYWAFLGRKGDYKDFLPVKENKGKLFQMIMYYSFLKKNHPATGKFNTLQKSTYNFWILLLVVQAISGFALYWPNVPFFASLVAMLGGLVWMRLLHYAAMWVFILTTMIHVYLSLVEDFKSFLLMFFGIEEKKA